MLNLLAYIVVYNYGRFIFIDQKAGDRNRSGDNSSKKEAGR